MPPFRPFATPIVYRRIGWTSDISPPRCYSAMIMQDFASQAHRLRRIRAISFDGDMTLWDFEAVMRHSLGHYADRVTGAPAAGEPACRSNNRPDDRNSGCR